MYGRFEVSHILVLFLFVCDTQEISSGVAKPGEKQLQLLKESVSGKHYGSFFFYSISVHIGNRILISSLSSVYCIYQ